MRIVRWFATIAALAGGCSDPAPPSSPGESPPRSAQPRAVALEVAKPLGVTLLAVRRVADDVEIEVALDRPLPPDDRTRPTLQVGDEVVRRSRAGTEGRLDRLVFTCSRERFERMPTDAPMIVRAGLASSEHAVQPSRLADVRATEVR